MSKSNAGDNGIKVLRAEEEWQRAGAYSVRVEGMNRQHHIPLREEFDEHDGPGTKYIVLLDDLYPVATCRFFEPDGPADVSDGPASDADGLAGDADESAYAGFSNLVMLGRVVVLPDYRGRGLGARAMTEAEKWIRELGYEHIGIDSRVGAVEFYEKLGYQVFDPKSVMSGPFECIRMVKHLSE